MATYYIDPNGNDTSGNGSISLPWRSPARACALVTNWGDIIHANAGSYNITSQTSVAAGVSIEGEGYDTVFNCSTARPGSIWGTAGYALLLSSGSNTDGDQSISYIRFEGGNSYSGWAAICVNLRNNVEIHHCYFSRFYFWGIRFAGGEPPAPGEYMTGASFHHNDVYNCAGFNMGATQSGGGLFIGGVDGMQIYNNSIVQPVIRGTAREGEPIYGVEGFVKNTKIFNNTITKEFTMEGFDFAIEIWNWENGNEIYGNTITGSVDIQEAVTHGYPYSVWVHDNVIGQPNLKMKQSVRGVLLEVWNNGVIIEHNFIHHVGQGVYCRSKATHGDGSDGEPANNYPYNNDGHAFGTSTNIKIRYNIFTNIGAAAGTLSPTGWAFYNSEEAGDCPINDFQFHNNVCIASTVGVNTGHGVQIPDSGVSDNIVISNNIIQGFDGAPVRANDWGNPTTITNLKIQNNIFYNNGNGNAPYFAPGVSHPSDTIEDNITTAPPFVSSSDFHLTEEREGIFIGYGLTDMDGSAVGDPPTIGAYQFGPYVPPEPATDLKGFTRGWAWVLIDNYKGGPWGWIPDSLDFTLQDVCNVVLPAEDTLTSCFQYAIPWYFDPRYEGDHDRLSNFRNYGPRGTGGNLRGWISDVENKATVIGTLSFTSTGNNTSGQTNGTSNVTGTMYRKGSLVGIIPDTENKATVIGTLKARYQTNVEYGFYYNGYVIGDSRGLANDGWSIASRNDYITLATRLGGNSVAGGYMKEAGLTHWNTPNTGADNSSGFTGVGAGYRSGTTGVFASFKTDAWLMTSTITGSVYYFIFTLGYNTQASTDNGATGLKFGTSVRLVRNSTDLEAGEEGQYIGNDGKIYKTIGIGDSSGVQEWMVGNLCETKYHNGDDIPEVIPNADWIALTTGAWCVYGTPYQGSLRGVVPDTDNKATVTGTMVQPLPVVKGYIKGMVHAGAGRDFGPYTGSTMPVYSHDGTQGKAFGFSFIDQAGFYLSKYGGYIRKIGSPNFTITFRLAVANSNGTPNLRGSVAPVTLGSINASSLSSTSPSYWYCNRLLTAGTRYVIYMTYSNISVHNNTNKIEIQYVTDQDRDCNIIQATVGPQGQMGGWSLLTTGELYQANIFLGGVIGTLTGIPEEHMAGSTWGIADIFSTVSMIVPAPTSLTATTYSDTRIDLAWTNGMTYDSIKIERSTNGTDFTQIDSIAGDSVSYQSTSLTAGTQYWYRVRGQVSSFYSGYSNTADDWTSVSLTVSARGDGSGVASFAIKVSSSLVLNLSGSARFYTDPAGTQGESTTTTVAATGALVIKYIKCPSGTCNLQFMDARYLIGFGHAVSLGSTNPVWGRASGGSYDANTPGLNASNWIFPNCVDFGIAYAALVTFATDLSALSPNLERACLESSVSFTGELADIGDSCTLFYIGGPNTISGNMSDMPSGMQYFSLSGSNTITGDIANLPASMIRIDLTGSNTLSGDIADLPQGTLDHFYVAGVNTIHGAVADLNYTGCVLTHFTVYGYNTISGDPADIPSSVTRFELSGSYHTFSGDIADIPSAVTWIGISGNLASLTGNISNLKTGLIYFYCGSPNDITGDVANLPSTLTTFTISGSNTVSGDIANLPSNLGSLNIAGLNTLSGNISGLPASMTSCTIQGSNTVTGSVTGLPSNMRYFTVYGSNTISGTIAQIPSALITFIVTGLNTMSGDLANIPNTITNFILQGNNTVDAYTSGKTWNDNFRYQFTCSPAAGGGLDSTEIDNLFIDLDTSWTTTRSQGLDFRGTNAAPTAASLSARNSLISKGRTIYTN